MSLTMKEERRQVAALQKQFADALDTLIEEVKGDRSVLAAILCGSLSHDVVWSKSDIDLLLVTVDDRKFDAAGVALFANGVNVHTILMPRGEFRKLIEGSVHNSFCHALLAKGKILYSHDPSIADLLERVHTFGDRDTRIQLLHAATNALLSLHKAQKWFVTRRDLDYTALWILYAATPLAEIEVINARLIVDREVIPVALKLNPEFFKVVYTDMLNAKKTERSVKTALDAIDNYLSSRTTMLFGIVIEHLKEVREARSCTEIEDHFKRNFDISGVTTACEYLADRGLIDKVSIPLRLTRKSTAQLQELAFVYTGESND